MNAVMLAFNVPPRRVKLLADSLLGTPSTLATAILNADNEALQAAKATVETHATTPYVFNAVFYTILSGSSSNHLLAQASDQLKYKHSVQGDAAADDATVGVVNLDFNSMVECIEMAESIQANAIVEVFYADLTHEFCSVVLTLPQIQKLFRSGHKLLHRFLLWWLFGFPRAGARFSLVRPVVREALMLEGFSQFIKPYLKLLQDKIENHVVLPSNVAFMKAFIEGGLALVEEDKEKDADTEQPETSGRSNKRKAKKSNEASANKKQKTSNETRLDEQWLKTILMQARKEAAEKAGESFKSEKLVLKVRPAALAKAVAEGTAPAPPPELLQPLNEESGWEEEPFLMTTDIPLFLRTSATLPTAPYTPAAVTKKDKKGKGKAPKAAYTADPHSIPPSATATTKYKGKELAVETLTDPSDIAPDLNATDFHPFSMTLPPPAKSKARQGNVFKTSTAEPESSTTTAPTLSKTGNQTRKPKGGLAAASASKAAPTDAVDRPAVQPQPKKPLSKTKASAVPVPRSEPAGSSSSMPPPKAKAAPKPNPPAPTREWAGGRRERKVPIKYEG